MKLTTESMVLILEVGAECVNTAGKSKGSSIEFEIWIGVEVILCAKLDPTVGVWLLDRDLADLKN